MIDFRKSWLGYNTVFQITGSSIPRAVVPALLAGAICAIFEHVEIIDEYITENILASQPYQIYFWIVSFATVFR